MNNLVFRFTEDYDPLVEEIISFVSNDDTTYYYGDSSVSVEIHVLRSLLELHVGRVLLR